jgi:hypothetical protein
MVSMLNPTFFPGSVVGSNAHINTTTIGPTTGLAPQAVYATPATAGLIVTAVDQYSLDVGSPLRTFDAGQPLGPDFDALATNRANLLAGVVV